MAPLAFDLCFSYNTTGEYYKITEMTPKVMALLEKTGRESEFFGTGVNLYSVLLANCAQATARLGNYKEGLALCEKALRFQRNIDDLYGIGFIEFSYGYVFIQKGDGKGAIEHFKKAMRHFEDGQMLLFLPLCWSGLGWGYYLLGELETARKNIEKGLKMQHDSGTSFVLSFHYYILGLTHLDLGDLKEARICIEEALRLAENNNEKQFEGRSRILLGRVLGKADTSQSGAAEELILQGIRILDDLKLRPHACQGYLYLGELCANTGQRKKALEYLEKAESTFREMVTDYWLRRTQEVMELVKG